MSCGTGAKGVSIPVWFDWEWLFKASCLYRLDVSIPVWFDWEGSGHRQRACPHQFQFQYGSIGRIILCILSQDMKAFQFQYGSIGSVLPNCA